MKKLVLLISVFFLGVLLFAGENSEQTESAEKIESAEKAFQTHIIPALGFQTLQLDEKAFIHSPSVNLQFLGIKNQKVTSGLPDSIMIGAGYSMDYYTQAPASGNTKRFHGANIMASSGFGKNNLTAMFSSNAEIPFSNIESVIWTMLYTRQLVKTENISFVLGGGLIAGDFGIKIKEMPLYFFALPMFSFNYSNQILSTSLVLMGLPSLQIALFPESAVSLKSRCSVGGFSSIRDLNFDSALVYYPLKNKNAGQLLSISAGVSNQSAGTVLRDKTKIKYQYYSLYGEISAILLTIRCGYNFDGKKFVNDEESGSLYKGIFASIQAMYMF